MTEEEKSVNIDQEAAVAAEEPKTAEAAPQQEQITLPESEEIKPLAEEKPAPEVSPLAGGSTATVEPAPEITAEEKIPEPPAEEKAKEQPAVEAKEDEPAAASLWRDKEKISRGTMVGIGVVLVIILALIYFAAHKPAETSADAGSQKVRVSDVKEQGKVNIIEETKNDIVVAAASGEEPAYPQTEVTAYFGNTEKNPNSADCSLTYPLERQINKKYDSNMINTMLGLLEPLSAAEKEQSYFSAIPSGTILKYLKLDDSGVISVNLSGSISQAAGSCAVAAIKAQIRDTISQFAAVKSVVICIDGNCNESETLQP